MELSISQEDLKEYVRRQLAAFLPDSYDFVGGDVDTAFALALERTEYCFEKITLRGYTVAAGGGRWQAKFSHLHSDQYSQFLYYLSNSLWRTSENMVLCSKLINLNKILNGMFYSFKGGLPDIFLLGHPVGTIIGNACYSDFLVILQNVTVNTGTESGTGRDLKLGKGLFLGAGAKIIGNSPIGDRVSIGVDAVVNQQAIPADSVVLRNDRGEVVIRPRRKERCMAQNYFNVPIL